VFRCIARLAVSQIIFLIPHFFAKFSLFSVGTFSKCPLLPRVREIKFWPWQTVTLPNGAELAHKLLFLPFPELIPSAKAFPLSPPKPPTLLSSPKIITRLNDKTNQDTLILS